MPDQPQLPPFDLEEQQLYSEKYQQRRQWLTLRVQNPRTSCFPHTLTLLKVSKYLELKKERALTNAVLHCNFMIAR